MDLASVGGIVAAGIILVVVMILDGGSPAELFSHAAPIILTLGGSAAIATATGPIDVLFKLPKYFRITFTKNKYNEIQTIMQITSMADKARREGLLALEDESKKVDDNFLRKGIMLVVDGIEPAQVQGILELEISQMKQRHEVGINWFVQAGGFSPTFGIIGTVMGLINVLKELSDPEKLAISIASAFLATLWGLLSANMIWLPIGGKLSARNFEEVAYRKMLVEGILALQAGENPRLIKEKLLAFLPPDIREKANVKVSAAPEANA
ncbi:MAG: motility protein A [Anaerolineaceae bacterium]|nr:motility protein A [Anaerolineaceae bacterium]